MNMQEKILNGQLVTVRLVRIQIDAPSFSENIVRKSMSEIGSQEVNEVLKLETDLHGFVSSLIQIVGKRKTLVFAQGLAHAVRIVEILNRHSGGSAIHVSSNKFDTNKGKHQFWVTCKIYQEHPSIHAVAIATGASQKSFSDMCMCAMLPEKGKSEALVLDYVGCSKYKLV